MGRVGEQGGVSASGGPESTAGCEDRGLERLAGRQAVGIGAWVRTDKVKASAAHPTLANRSSRLLQIEGEEEATRRRDGRQPTKTRTSWRRRTIQRRTQRLRYSSQEASS